MVAALSKDGSFLQSAECATDWGRPRIGQDLETTSYRRCEAEGEAQRAAAQIHRTTCLKLGVAGARLAAAEQSSEGRRGVQRDRAADTENPRVVVPGCYGAFHARDRIDRTHPAERSAQQPNSAGDVHGPGGADEHAVENRQAEIG